jgi:hypothetical protein
MTPDTTVQTLPLLSTICFDAGMLVPLGEATTAGGARLAAQDAVVPLMTAAQLQVQGPLPLNADAAPVLHKLVVGAVFTVVALAVPQTPLIAGGLPATQVVPFHDHHPPAEFS